MERFARTKCQEISKAKRCILLFHYKQPLVAWASKRQCPREALFKVVKVVQVVFLHQQAIQVENHHAVLLTGVRRGVLRDDPWAGGHPEVP